MEKQYVAMKAFIIDLENDTIFLMRKGSKDKLNPGKWEVPGGKMEFGETTDETFKREVFEECGLDIEIGEMITKPWQWTFTKSNGENVQIIAIGRVCKAKNEKVDFSNQTETDDLVECAKVPINEVLKYDLIPNLIPTMEDFVKRYYIKKMFKEDIFVAKEKEELKVSSYTI